MRGKTRFFVAVENLKSVIPFLKSEYPQASDISDSLCPKKQNFVHYSPGIAISLKLQPEGTACSFLLCVQLLLAGFTCYSSSYSERTAPLQREHTNNFPSAVAVGKLGQRSVKFCVQIHVVDCESTSG